MKVKDMMTPDPACCTPEEGLHEVARLMVEYDCGEIPVVESMETLIPVGVITDRDIACRAVAQGNSAMEKTAGECMSSPCITVSPETSLEDCCRVLQQHQIRRVPVVDDDGLLCGIVSQADIAICGTDERTAQVLREVSQAADTPRVSC